MLGDAEDQLDQRCEKWRIIESRKTGMSYKR
jgi:hypothetical protein